MTPLAHRLMKRFTLPKRMRDNILDHADLLDSGLLTDFHCFEVSAVSEIVEDITFNRIKNHEEEDMLDSLRHLVFLPAPRTWVESNYFYTRNKNGDMVRLKGRVANYLVETGDDMASEYTILSPELTSQLSFSVNRAIHPDTWIIMKVAQLNLKDHRFYWLKEMGDKGGEVYKGRCWLSSCLVVINSPKIIMREKHHVHKGLARDLQKMRGGKFPLHAWTEIKLKVATREVDESGESRSYLTGARAQYFCRKYVRVRFGRLEYVKAHWRGDPSLGIRRSRYTVEP